MDGQIMWETGPRVYRAALVVAAVAALVVGPAPSSAAWGDFGAGSSSTRLKDIQESMTDFKEMVSDTEHIQEEFEDLFSQDDLLAMGRDELAFTWFSAHDTDDDGHLDGLEIFKAVHHSSENEVDDLRRKGGYAGEQPVEDALQEATVELVDELLSVYDLDQDGKMDFIEFMSSFTDNKDRLKIKAG